MPAAHVHLANLQNGVCLVAARHACATDTTSKSSKNVALILSNDQRASWRMRASVESALIRHQASIAVGDSLMSILVSLPPSLFLAD